MTSSPKFKNLGLRPKQSPIEIKEKMRKNYKNKVQNCRGMLMDKLRGPNTETNLYATLTEIYKSLINIPEVDEDDVAIMNEVRNELIQEELEWWVKEYEKCQMMNVDWSAVEENNDVICPICQKNNLQLSNGNVACIYCSIHIPTSNTLLEIKKNIFSLVDNHNSMCNSDVQFNFVPAGIEPHIYLVCETCMQVKLVI